MKRLVSAAVLVALPLAASAQETGPSSSAAPYVLPSRPDVKTTSILTVGDTIGGYRLVGIPDGLGAFRNTGGYFTLLVNHELGDAKGIVRAHGSKGAFVSRWVIDREEGEVLRGEDFTPSPLFVYTWDRTALAYKQGTTAWNRFCSADLAGPGAFWYEGRGARERIFLNGEEYDERDAADHGRAFAHLATGPFRGESWELPRLGRVAFENVVASPHPQRKTILIGMDDADRVTDPGKTKAPSELYVYVGTKQREGHPVERAGLTNGDLYGVQVRARRRAVTEESNDYGLGGPVGTFVDEGTFSLYEFGDVSGWDGIKLQDEAIRFGITRFQRIEDGAWDPRAGHENDFYFATTANVDTNSRLWRLRFRDIERPKAGGTLEILLDGSEGHKMLDNLAVDRHGRILLQEDVGNNDRLGKVWLYSIAKDELVEVAAHDAELFTPVTGKLGTKDEESSGIIDAESILGRGWFLLGVQAHTAAGVVDEELVEKGQIVALYIDPKIGR